MSVCVHERGHRCVSAAVCVCVGQVCSHKHLCTCVSLVNTWCMLMSTCLLDVVVCVHVSVYVYIRWHVFTRVCPGVYLCASHVCMCMCMCPSLLVGTHVCACACWLWPGSQLSFGLTQAWTLLAWPGYRGLLREDEGSGMPGRSRSWVRVEPGAW